MSCDFVKVLSSLQKHSAESVDYVEHLSEQSRYLHVERPIQKDLIALLERESAKEGKSLVLLCGSAGDGKSHMLSYVKNTEYGHLLENFTIRNDATESDGPFRTAPETLADALSAFSDARLDDGGKEKVAVAINLGLLSRFLESEPGAAFGKLHDYVEKAGLLSTGLSKATGDGPFHAVDFSDYQIFTIDENGVKTDFLDELYARVLSDRPGNRFYESRRSVCEGCIKGAGICPVRQNFDFLGSESARRKVVDMIVESALVEKCVITARSALNYLHEAIVPPAFDIGKLTKEHADNPGQFASSYLGMTTPQLLFDAEESGQLVGKMAHYDPVADESGWYDEHSIRVQADSAYLGKLTSAIRDTPYEEMVSQKDAFASHASRDGRFSQELLKALVRCAYLNGRLEGAESGFATQSHVPEFASYIYSYNTGNDKGLRKLCKPLLEKALEDWNGDYPSGYALVCTYGNVQVLQEQKVTFGHSCEQVQDAGELTRFRPFVKVNATLNKHEGEYVTFQIDYNLFVLLKRIQDGYQPTLTDKNRFKGFEDDYERLLAQSTKGSVIYLADRTKSKKPFMKLSLEDYDGYLTLDAEEDLV